MQYADVTCIISDPEGHFWEKKYFELIRFSLPNISRVFSVRISGLFSVRYLSRSLGFIPRRRYGFNPRRQDLAARRGPSLPRRRQDLAARRGPSLPPPQFSRISHHLFNEHERRPTALPAAAAGEESAPSHLPVLHAGPPIGC